MTTISKDTEIQTDRLRLRATSESDVDLVWSASRHSGFNDWMTWDAPKSMAELEGIAKKNAAEWDAGKSYNFTIELTDSGEGIGRITIRREGSVDTWNIGYWVHPDYWGQGYATEASQAILEFGKSVLLAAKITIAHAIENVASQKVIEKLGFTRTAENPCGFTKNSMPVAEYEYVINFHAH
jgi:ribosomal-protein-alanine N-acetyltransferase